MVAPFAGGLGECSRRVAWAVTTGNVEAASTISGSLIWAALWHDTGEPYLWVQTVAAMPGAAGGPMWSSVLAGCASEVLAAGVAIAEQHGAYTALMTSQRTLARIYVRDGRTGEAAALLIPSLQALRRKASWMFLRQNIYYAISTLFEAEAVETAAVLFGAVRSSSAAGHAGFARRLQQLHDQFVAALGAERLERTRRHRRSPPDRAGLPPRRRCPRRAPFARVSGCRAVDLSAYGGVCRSTPTRW